MFETHGGIHIPESEFQWSYARSSGPGGQNVNKVASKAVLRWNIRDTPSVPEAVRDRLLIRQRKRITREGDLIIQSQRFRDQDRNRVDCLEKLRQIVEEAVAVPKRRRPTTPTRGSRMNRLKEKKKRSRIKALRRAPSDE